MARFVEEKISCSRRGRKGLHVHVVDKQLSRAQPSQSAHRKNAPAKYLEAVIIPEVFHFHFGRHGSGWVVVVG